jgi:hypothetical protein
MKGPELKGTNPGSAEFSGAFNKVSQRAFRDHIVQIDTGGGDQKSRFIESDEDLTLIIRRQDLLGVTGGDGTFIARLCVGGTAVNYTIQGGETPDE